MKIILIFLTLLAIGFVYAQDSKNKIDYGKVEDESADATKGTQEASLYKVAVDTFERAGEWRATMPLEYGLITIKEIPGSPIKTTKQELEKWQKEGEDVQAVSSYGQRGRNTKGSYFEPEKDFHRQVLGVRVDFMQRGYGWARIEPPFPIKLEGMVKGFEVWVNGRNKRHKLYLLLKDFYGEEKILEIGQLNFLGWKKMSVQIPYTIVQEDFRFSTRRGLTFLGFILQFHPEETAGKYYIYFDNIYVEISRFLEENRDEDDILDVW